MQLPPFRKPNKSRAQNMRAIRSTGNQTTEKRLMSLLNSCKLKGWQLQPVDIPGKPDLFARRKRVAVFVDGCFWHGCHSCGHIPKRNAAYWRAKILRNRRRDVRISRLLRAHGYSVIRIRECQLRLKPDRSVERIKRALRVPRPRRMPRG